MRDFDLCIRGCDSDEIGGTKVATIEVYKDFIARDSKMIMMRIMEWNGVNPSRGDEMDNAEYYWLREDFQKNVALSLGASMDFVQIQIILHKVSTSGGGLQYSEWRPRLLHEDFMTPDDQITVNPISSDELSSLTRFLTAVGIESDAIPTFSFDFHFSITDSVYEAFDNLLDFGSHGHDTHDNDFDPHQERYLQSDQQDRNLQANVSDDPSIAVIVFKVRLMGRNNDDVKNILTAPDSILMRNFQIDPTFPYILDEHLCPESKKKHKFEISKVP